jgi:hypothetical protein
MPGPSRAAERQPANGQPAFGCYLPDAPAAIARPWADGAHARGRSGSSPSFPQFQPWRERRWRAGAGWRSSNPTYLRGGRGTIAHQKQLCRRGANQLQPGSRAALGGARSGEQAAVAEPPVSLHAAQAVAADEERARSSSVLLCDERGTELALLLLPQQQRAGLADIGGLAVPEGRAPSGYSPFPAAETEGVADEAVRAGGRTG